MAAPAAVMLCQHPRNKVTVSDINLDLVDLYKFRVMLIAVCRLYVSELVMSAQVSAAMAVIPGVCLVVRHVAGTFPRADVICFVLCYLLPADPPEDRTPPTRPQHAQMPLSVGPPARRAV